MRDPVRTVIPLAGGNGVHGPVMAVAGLGFAASPLTADRHHRFDRRGRPRPPASVVALLTGR